MSTLPHPNEGGDFTPPPAGTFPAVCYRVIDLGTQKSEFQGETKIQRKILLSWEIADEEERMPDGRPFSLSSRYTWSMHEKATLRRDLESWRGKAFVEADFGPEGFNIRKLVGAPCMLNVVHKLKDGKTFGNVGSIAKMPRGMVAAPLVNTEAYLWIDHDGFDRHVFDNLSDKLKSTIIVSPEYVAMTSNGSSRDDRASERHDLDDDIPF